MKTKLTGRVLNGIGALTAMALLSCGGGNGPEDTPAPPPAGQTTAAMAGKAIFFDASLSVSGKQSCGTCHVPSRAFTADPATDRGLPVPLGGPTWTRPGSQRALADVRLVHAAVFADRGPTGGFFRDGRASSLATQAQQPFITPFEMANQDAAEVVGRLQNSPATLQAFVAVYGEAALDDPRSRAQDMGLAIAAYETEDPSFHPFSSKYDFWLQGQAQLTAQEQSGLTLFNNPVKGNCTACHPSQRQGYNSHALFTDFTFDNIGVPRNWKIPANTPGSVSPDRRCAH